ncbi:MAG: hypothetical protein IJK89_03925 [Clostridia bacterium]|nr:hypothetical protein [Clostridia bacterium]
MNVSHKPYRFICILLAACIVFAVNAPVLLQRTSALIWNDDPTDEPEPPVTDPEPPVTDPEPPVTDPEPPVTDPEPPVTDPEPPVTDPEPPVTYPPVTQPPVSQYPEPPVSDGTTAPGPLVTEETVPETTTTPGYIPSIIDKYNAVKEFFTDTQLDDQNIASTDKDQNAVHIGGGNVIINNAIISRVNNASTTGEKSVHYGVGSVILATNGTGFISKSTINSEAKAATGAFAYGNAQLYLADTQITTAQQNAHGVETAETGQLYAWDMTVQTLGEGASPVYSGAGNGKMVLDGGSYLSTGIKAPSILCAADIATANATFTADQSEAAVVKGGNTLTLCDTQLSGNMRTRANQSFQWTVLLYQPGTKDKQAVANFYMQNGTLTSKSGGLFYTTNTTSNIYLENVTLKPYKNSDFLVRCTGNAEKEIWGAPMKNGSACNFTAVRQDLEGNVVWDTISQISLYVKDGSTFTGAFIKDETYRTNTGFADLYLGEGCTWTVAGDSVLTNLYNGGTIADTSGNTVTIKKADGTVIAEGTSAYTIVVTSYQTKADMAGAQRTPDWTKISTVRPAALGASLAEITTVESTETSTTPAQPDDVYERRKEVAKYVLIGVGVIAAAALVVWVYQANKYKLKKLMKGQR